MNTSFKSSHSVSGHNDGLKFDQSAARKSNLNSIRKNKSLDATSRNSLFWNGVHSLLKVHKNDKFDVVKLKSDSLETGISLTNHKVSSCHLISHKTDILIINLIIDINNSQKGGELYWISPSGHRKLAWDILVGTVIFYSIIEVPFRIAFQPSKSTNIGYLDIIVEGLFFFDILVTFNTAYVDPVTNFLIADRRLISLKYASFWLWIDSVSTIPFDEILIAVSGHDTAHNLSAVRLSRILRLFRLTKLLRLLGSASMKEFLDKYMISPALISIATLLLQIFVIAHIICCFWFFISTPDVTGFNNDDAGMVLNTWVKSFGFQESDIKTQYIASLYWAFATMLTVGYGDIYPTNSGERLYALCTMLLGSVVFGAIISKVRVLVESRNLQLKELKVDVAEFKAYLEERRIPNSLRAEAKVSIKVSSCYL